MSRLYSKDWASSMNWDLTFAPLVSWPVLVALALIGLAFIAVTVVTRGRGWILRSLTLALLLAALVNPSLRNEDRENLSTAHVQRNIPEPGLARQSLH